MSSCAVAVVGHVDHGKTSLVRALTGQETDLLQEEKMRGLSIALGFAYRAYATGTVDFIDSPGHEDFIRTMICGATGAQAALIVVSAVDGVERQTLEHLQILQYLDVRTGLVAVTKSDLVETSARAVIKADILAAFGRASFALEPAIFCSAETGEGLDALHAELAALIQRAPAAINLPGAFLPADRVFSVKGVGTVATGTLLGAPLEVGDAVDVLPRSQSTSIRRLQSRGSEVSIAHPGARTAVNLRGVGVDDVKRGDVICASGRFQPSHEVDAYIEGASEYTSVKHGERVRVLTGTHSQVATAYIWGAEKTLANGCGFVRLRFRDPIATHAKQRGILRRLSPAEMIGGVQILDPSPPPIRRRDVMRQAVLQAVHAGDVIDIAQALARAGGGIARHSLLAKLTGVKVTALRESLASDFVEIDAETSVPKPLYAEARTAYLNAIAKRLANTPALHAVPAPEIQDAFSDRFAGALLAHALEGLLASGELIGDRNLVTLPDRDPFSELDAHDREQLQRLERLLQEGGVSPPSLADLHAGDGRAADLLKLLVEADRVVFLRNVALKQTLAMHFDSLHAAYVMLGEAFPPPTEFTMSEARMALDTTRKFAIPILEYFDKVGWTRRRGDIRQIVMRDI